ncbi:MAG TPA: hypothetical protein VGQ16_07110 [Vicinamibacterales bacterium]|jgi:hypothetical protein|nr:hypothetical protein [Vicinamibacterales bacterium]
MRSRSEEHEPPRMPETGDVVVSNPSATVDYDVIVVPHHAVLCARHDVAVAKGQELAERLGVDLWLTQDHTHFLRLASYRHAAR